MFSSQTILTGCVADLARLTERERELIKQAKPSQILPEISWGDPDRRQDSSLVLIDEKLHSSGAVTGVAIEIVFVGTECRLVGRHIHVDP